MSSGLIIPANFSGVPGAGPVIADPTGNGAAVLTRIGGAGDTLTASGTVNLQDFVIENGATGAGLSATGATTILSTGLTVETGAGQGIDLNTLTGAASSFTNTRVQTTSGHAIDIVNSTVSFSGGLDIDTTSGTGFSATGGGSISVAASAGDESITATAGQALNLDGISIGAGGVNFDSLSSTNAGNGNAGLRFSALTGGGSVNITNARVVDSGGAGGGNGIELTGIRMAGALTIANIDIDMPLTGGNTLSGIISFGGHSSTLNLGTGAGGIAIDDAAIGIQMTGTASVINLGAGAGSGGVQLTTSGRAINLGSDSTGTINIGNAATTSMIDAGNGSPADAAIVFNQSDATVMVTGIDINGTGTAATGHGLHLLDNDGVGSFTLNGASTLDNTGGDAVRIEGVNASISGVTIGASATGAGNDITGNGVTIVDNGQNISVSITNVTVADTRGAGIRMDGSGAGSITVNAFNGTTISDADLRGVDILDVTFDAVTGGAVQQVAGGNLTVGAIGDRVEGDGVRLDQVLGDIAFGTVDIFNNNGTGLFIRDAAGKGGIFAFGNTGGTIDATNGAAVDIDPVTMNSTFASLTSTASAGRGVNLDTIAGTFTVTGTTSITGSTTQGVRVVTSTAAINLGTLNVSGTTGAAVLLQNNTGGSFTATGGTVTKGGAGDALGINGGAMGVNFGADISHTSNGGDAVSILGGTTGNITVSGTIANTVGGRPIDINTVTGGTVSFTGASVTSTVGVQIANVAAGASVNFSAGTTVTINGSAVVGINLSNNAGAIAFNGAVEINGARDGGIAIINANANVSFGQLDIEMSNAAAAANDDAIAIGGTPGVLSFGATTITNVGAAAGQKGIDFSGTALGGTVTFESVAISGPATSADSVGVDLTGVAGNQIVNLGSQVNPATGPSSSIANLHRGVVIDNTAAIQFTFGDGENGDTPSTIDVNGQAGAFTVDAGGGTLASSSFDFNDVAFGAGDNANLPVAGGSAVFVSETGGAIAAGTHGLSQALNTITVAAAEAQADTNQTFVFVAHSGAGTIDLMGGGVDGFTLLAGQALNGFDDGNVIGFGVAQPANIEGNLGAVGGNVTQDSVTASNSTAGATAIITTAAGAGGSTVENTVFDATGLGAGDAAIRVDGTGAASPVTINNVEITNVGAGASAVLLNNNTSTVALSDVDLFGANAGSALSIDAGAASAGAVTVDAASDLDGTTGTIVAIGGGARDVTISTSIVAAGNTSTIIDIDGQTGGTIGFGPVTSSGATGDSVIETSGQTGGSLTFGNVAITTYGNASTDTAVELAGSGGSVAFADLDITTTNGGGFAASGGGLSTTVTSGDVNVSGAAAVTLDNVRATSFTLTSITANGGATAADGVVLNNLVAGSSFSVTGTSTLDNYTDAAVQISNLTTATHMIGFGATDINQTASVATGRGIVIDTVSGTNVDIDFGATRVGLAAVTQNGLVVSNVTNAATGFAVDLASLNVIRAQTGLLIDNVDSGSVEVTGFTRLDNAGTRNLSVQGSTANVSFGGAFGGQNNSGFNGAIVNLGDATANTGTTSFAGQTTLTASGTASGGGVVLGSGSATFNAGLDITTVDGVGLTASGGTLTVANAGTEQIVTSGTGQAMVLDGVTVAAGGMTFDQVTTASTATAAVAGNGVVDIHDAVGGAITLTSVTLAGTATTAGLDVSGGARASNVVVSGGTIGNGVRINGTGSGTVQIDANVSETAGYAFQLANRSAASGAVTVGGTVSGGFGAISVQSSTGGTATFNGVVTGTGSNTSGAIDIDATTGGTVTFAALVDIDVTGAGTGVMIGNGNAGGTINFSGGLDINSVNGVGFEALSGAMSVSATAGNERIMTTAGQALNVSGVAIGAAGVTFDSVSSTNAGDTKAGIRLNALSGAGAVTITTATVVDSGGAGGGNAIDLTGLTMTGALTIANIDIDLPTTGGNGLRGIMSNGGHSSSIILGTGAGGVAIDDAAFGIQLNGAAGTINIGTGAGSGGVQLNTRGDGIHLGSDSTGTINIGTTATASVIVAGTAGAGSPGIIFNQSDATVTVTGIDINAAGSGAAGHGIHLLDNDTAGSFTLTGSNSIDNTGGNAILVDNAAATISGVTIGASAGGVGDDITGAGIRIDNTDGNARTVALSDITMGAAGATGDVAGIGIDINSSGAGVLTVNLTGTNVIGSTGQALDVDETNGTKAANNLLLNIDNTTFESAAVGVPSVEVTGQNVSTSTSSVGVRSFSDNTVVGNSSTSHGGILFTRVDFDNGAGGQVAGGTLNIGQSTGARVSGDGLSLIDPTGNLGFAALNIFNNAGTGLEVDTKTSGANTVFNLANAGGTVDTTNGTALLLDPLTMELTFGSVTAAGGTNGVFIDAGDASGAAPALIIGNLTVTGSTGAGLRIKDSTGTFSFGPTRINNAATAGGGVAIEATAAGGDTLNVNFNGGLDIDTTSGTGFDAQVNVAPNVFNLQIENSGTETINTTTGRVLVLRNTNATGAGINFDNLEAGDTVAGNVIELDLESGTFNGGNVTIAGTSAGGQDGILISGGGAGSSINFASAIIDNALGAAINMNAASTVTFTTVNIDGGATGVSVTATGAFTISDGSIGATTSTSGRPVEVLGGGGAVNIAASVSKSSAGELVRVSGRTGGTVTLSGTLSATGAATGINVLNNTGGTITFSGGTKTLTTGANAAVTLTTNTGATVNFTGGGLDIGTTSATGFLATGGGTVNVSDFNNSVTSTTGTAVSMDRVTIGSGATFASITSGGGANGILLQHVDGAFTVTGTATLNNSTSAGLNLFNSNGGNDGNLTFAANTLNISNTSGGGAFIQRGAGTGRTDVDVTTGTIDSGSRTPIFISNSDAATIDLGATFTSVSMNGNANGIFINNSLVTGTISGALDTGTGGTIQNTGANAVNMNRLSANITIGSAVTTASGGIRVTNQVSGTNTFSGVHTLTGAGSGYLFDSNAGGATNVTGNVTASTLNGAALTLNTSAAHAVTFSGTNTALSTTTGKTVDISAGATVNFNSTGTNTITATTTGKGVEANGGGTLVIGGTANVTSANGTAIDIQNTTIGAAGVSFESVSANGAVNGIVLNTTGSTGGFTVTGSGTTAGSGGTIQNTTGSAILLATTRNVSLSNLDITTTGLSGIEGTTVTNLDLTRVRITNPGDAAGEHGINLTNLLGTSAASLDSQFDTISISGAHDKTIAVLNTSATNGSLLTPDLLTIVNSTLTNSGTTGDGIEIIGNTGGNFSTIVSQSLLDGHETNGIQAQANTGGQIQLEVTRTTIRNSNQGIDMGVTATSSLRFNIHDNNNIDGGGFSNFTSNAISVNAFDLADYRGTIFDNEISVKPPAAVSAGNGIRIGIEGNGTGVVNINSNTITNIDEGRGIHAFAIDGTGTLDLQITNNTVTEPAVRDGMGFFAGNTGGDANALCINMSGNDSAGPAAFSRDAYAFEINDDGASIRIQGLTDNSSFAAINNFVVSLNTAGDTSDSNDGLATGNGLNRFLTSGTCATP
ncbi:hypothetical protein PZ897_01855 [Hoeflea sp. YIM 152468]|uniref:hypothetical protein n=1 Tax=Hoeflea sp. YIM 152468 TaxID=3031759 RepID=UPI0023DCE56C|nr:hypothetical protein [Hoeflea sp. YIM 152468]MDF1606914.1 hypothetical protein [Hoeflea sp. YIM 152468]